MTGVQCRWLRLHRLSDNLNLSGFLSCKRIFIKRIEESREFVATTPDFLKGKAVDHEGETDCHPHNAI